MRHDQQAQRLREIDDLLAECQRNEMTGVRVSYAQLRAMRDSLAAPVQPAAVAEAPDDWRQQASRWLIAQAEKQEQTNRDCPLHVKAYPEWEEWPRRLRILASRALDATPAPVAPTDRAAAVEQAAALAEKVSGVDTANTIRHVGVVLHDRCQCIHCMRHRLMLKVSDIPDQVLRDIAGAYHRRLEQTLTEQQDKAERDFQRIAYLRTALEWLALWLNQQPAPVAQTVPDGFVLVPKEPTRAMWDAANKYENHCAVNNYGGCPDAAGIWDAMLAAAQAQEGK